MTAELIVLKGFPGCGKSTRAMELLKKHPNSIRVNRDSLRIMLHGPDAKWSKEREKVTASAEVAIAREALLNGKTVIADNTHLHPHTMVAWQGVAANSGAKLVIEDMTDVPLAVCIERDRHRSGSARVGRGVIDRMALQNKMLDLGALDKVAIVDIDGTLADLSHRLHYLEETPKNYDQFFEDVHMDYVYAAVWKAVLKLRELGHTIIVMSGRPASCGYLTNEWLNTREYETEWLEPVSPEYLFMRQSGDHRPDNQVKRQLFNMMLENGLRKEAIKIVLDDREQVCEVWRELELPLVKVDAGSVVSIAPAALNLVQDIGIPILF